MGWISLDSFRALVKAERSNSKVDVAGFAQWPYEIAFSKYEAAVLADDKLDTPAPGDV